ncbi:cell wall glyco-protein [Emericellopsis cladophorae]|uniref:Cell wall glyco-protein n=1 Tax=Emericellopsis cladophorae TaxID=2686198 RepID=A0A9P9XX21_9HYPO|nr:cell wall glyco-protein [Emericellopsis cladophorae]KAI6779426.1 cell wall glyco-protein [Emericellopsis cladophorae]
MKYAFVSALLAGLAQTTLAQTACLDSCQVADNACRTAPNANLSTCASNLAACREKCPAASPMSSSSTHAPVATHTPAVVVEKVVVCHVCEEEAAQKHAQCKAECQMKENACCTAPGAKQSTCSSDYAGCEAKCPPPTAVPQHGDECEIKCMDVDNKCRTTPDANLSTCASDLARCKASCPQQRNKYTPPPPGPHHGDCPECDDDKEQCHVQCKALDNECRTKPGANLSTCASELAGCEAKCPPIHHGEECEAKCQTIDNECRTKPGANLSTCASELDGCKAKCPAVPPYHGDECAVKCQTVDNECRTKPGANLSTCASDFDGCKAKCPATPPHNGDECDAQCQAADNKCRTAPGANLSTCASDLSACKSKCPVRTMTAMPHPVPTNSKVVVDDDNKNNNKGLQCTVECDTVYTECCALPGADIVACGEDKRVCYERCPADGHKNGTILTAGSERMQPAFMAVAALGFAALF